MGHILIHLGSFHDTDATDDGTLEVSPNLYTLSEVVCKNTLSAASNLSDDEEEEICEREGEREAFDLFQDFLDDEWLKIKVLHIQKHMKFFVLSSKPAKSHCINYDLEKFLKTAYSRKVIAKNFLISLIRNRFYKICHCETFKIFYSRKLIQ